jgi:hypothetical protein
MLIWLLRAFLLFNLLLAAWSCYRSRKYLMLLLFLLAILVVFLEMMTIVSLR